jgi:predicted site-specific integrase-resolvase
MHYYNGISAAKRIGISYKTLLRYIEKGKIRPEEAKTPNLG